MKTLLVLLLATVAGVGPAVNALAATNEAEAAAARADLVKRAGGVKTGFADGHVLLASTPDFNSQIAVADDGFVAKAVGTNAGNWTAFAVITTATIYFVQNVSLTEGSVNVGRQLTAGSQGLHYEHWLYNKGSDNVLNIQNLSSSWYSAICFLGANSDNRDCAIGRGGEAVPNSYGNRFYIAGNPPVSKPTSPPIDILFSQERGESAGYLNHDRLLFSGAGKSITTYGWTPERPTGPIGWHVAADGRMGIGTTNLGAAAQLTVAGSVAVSGAMTPADGVMFQNEPKAWTATMIGAGNVRVCASNGVLWAYCVDNATNLTVKQLAP
jgi:hypothetical protein